MSRLKPSSSKSAKTSSSSAASSSSSSDKNKRRKKKPTHRRVSSSSATHSTAASSSAPPPSSPPSTSMKNSASSSSAAAASAATGAISSPTGGTPTSSRECEQCGNPATLEVGASAKAVANAKKVASAANTGCHICDFVAFCKSQRHCMQCDRTHCDAFCEWCGQGLHTKCAKSRGEHIDAENGFCCKKCEAEQADDDNDEDDDGGANDVNAKCGECQLPFNTTAEVSASSSSSSSSRAAKNNPTDADTTGFKVNQSVLVENDEVLYNAVITDVDAKKERIKIHFLRWSKSFDNWYAMDDERINESLACDCCNRWFHIGCLPPIKSSGRFKDTTYVCPTCLDDARGFFNGTRSTALPSIANKAKSATSSSANTNSGGGASSSSSSSTTSSSRRRGAVAEVEASVPPKKRTTKPVVHSDDDDDDNEPAENENENDVEETKENDKDTARNRSKKTKDKDATNDTGGTSRKRRRSESIESAESNASAVDKKTKATKKTKASTKKSRSRSSSRGDDDVDATEPLAGDDADHDQETEDVKPSHTTESTPSTTDVKPEDQHAHNDVATDTKPEPHKPLTMDKPTIVRKVSAGHSVSSLLNSPSSPPRDVRNSPALRSASASSTPATTAASAASAASTVRVKVEKDPLQLPPPASKKRPSGAKVWVTGRDAKTAKASLASAPGSASSSSSSGAPPAGPAAARGPLSAFDILREVAAQSMSDDLPPTAPSGPVKKPSKARPSAAERKQKADAARSLAADKALASNGRQPPTSTSGGPLSGIGVGIPMNSFVDLHFAIRKEMYLRICMLEDERLLERETAQVLRAMIYPTSDKFHDLKFVYVVNKDLSSIQLTKRLLELVPVTSGGTAPVMPPPLPASMRPSLVAMSGGTPSSSLPPSLIGGSRNSSAAGSPVRRSTPSPAPESVDGSAGVEPEPETKPTPYEVFASLDKTKSLTSFMMNVTSAMNSAAAAAASASASASGNPPASPSPRISPPMLPPPIPTKLLMETMYMHSKLPTLLPPPPQAPSSSSTSAATSTAATTTSSASSSSSSTSLPSTVSIPSLASSTSAPSTSSSTATSVASSSTAMPSVATPPREPSPPLVNHISASISSN